MSKYTEENDYGCTKWDGVSDMTIGANGTLTEQLGKVQIPFELVPLSMGTLTADPAYFIHYASRITGNPTVILVFPQAGADSWCENYYYFPGMSLADAHNLNWHEVYEHVHAVATATMYANVPVASGTYKDIRNRVRCNRCHSLMQD